MEVGKRRGVKIERGLLEKMMGVCEWGIVVISVESEKMYEYEADMLAQNGDFDVASSTSQCDDHYQDTTRNERVHHMRG